MAQRRPWGSIVLFCLVLLSSLVLTRLTDQGTRHEGGGAAEFVAADGAVTWLGGGGRVEMVETQLAKGTQPMLNSSPIFVQAASMNLNRALDATWVIERHGPEVGFASRLLSVGPGGLATTAEVWPTGWTVHRPGRIDVPAQPRVGQTWQQQGNLRTSSAKNDLTYTSSGRVLAGSSPDCLRFEVREVWSEGTTRARELERCRGRGVVADHAAGMTLLPARPGELVAPQIGTTSMPPAQPDGRVLKVDHAGRIIQITPAAAPVLVTGGVALANRLNANLYLAVVADNDVLQVRWERHPGGSIETMAGVGELVVVSTTQRQLLAYDIQGQVVWRQHSSDVVQQVRLVQGRLITLTTNGILAGLDPATGAELWSRDLGTGNQTTLAGWRDRVAVGVADGLHVINAGSGETLLERQLPSGVAAVAPGGDAVLAIDDDGVLWCLGLDGQLRWRQLEQASVHHAVTLSDAQVVLAATPQSLLVDLATGQLRPLDQPAETAAVVTTSDGRRGVVLQGEHGWSWWDASGTRRAATRASWSVTTTSLSTPNTEPGPAVGIDQQGLVTLWGQP